MKRLLTLFALLAVTLLISQCSQITGPDEEGNNLSMEAVFSEIDANAQAIEALDEETLTDSTMLPMAVERALRHLDNLIERTHAIIDTANNTAADSLLDAAETVQTLAEDAAAADSLKLSFGYIRVGRHLSLEAIRTVKGEESPPPFIEHLWTDLDGVTVLCERTRQALIGQNAPVARRLFERGKMHLRLARAALTGHQFRRAHTHLHTSRLFFKRALVPIVIQ